ncbi:hypothetical protein [Amphritea pacifica]|uniref:Uncharacterized protein n=1 Tax=Amphritea pacifica TaxID=2811233 RepID=A0ABS2WA46_9GAMM|nr:hypothetical protein [Amphritea pacifica]MBN0988554.1 hypothetical protein [Amphritea pacifica]
MTQRKSLFPNEFLRTALDLIPLSESVFSERTGYLSLGGSGTTYCYGKKARLGLVRFRHTDDRVGTSGFTDVTAYSETGYLLSGVYGAG